jgi:hypothetical protein
MHAHPVLPRCTPWVSILLFAIACGGHTTQSSSQSSSGAAGDTGGTNASNDGTDAGNNNTVTGNAAAAACVYPANADTFSDASPVGCKPGPTAQTCQVSSGATILPDGGVANGTETCSPDCGPSQYELSCTSGPVGPQPNAIPSPDPSLGCTDIGEPTPSNYLFYCCPCAE